LVIFVTTFPDSKVPVLRVMLSPHALLTRSDSKITQWKQELDSVPFLLLCHRGKDLSPQQALINHQHDDPVPLGSSRPGPNPHACTFNKLLKRCSVLLVVTPESVKSNIMFCLL
ncbi:hypothetical protein ATANTOWER_014123, partial [Ataeniobius toweri]|nr:hypothetical protein [Ataeniobius toweri]